MTALSFIQPLNESGFVGAVVSGPAVKVQCLLTFGAGEQHHFVAIVGLGNLSGVIQALGGVALSPAGTVRHHILDEDIGTDTPGQVGDDDADAGGDDFAIHFIDNQVVIGVMEDL